MPGMLPALIWKRIDHPGAEYFHLIRLQDEIRLEGHVVIALAGSPIHVHYIVTCDAQWRTREVAIEEMIGIEERHLHLTVDGPRWLASGVELPDLRGCTEVDLEISPSTNTQIGRENA